MIALAPLFVMVATNVRAETFIIEASAGANASIGDLAVLDAGDTLRINFLTPFAATGDQVLRLDFATPGFAFNLRAGQGAGAGSTTVFTQNNLDSSGSPISIFSLAFQGCGLNIGCDFLEIDAVGLNNPSASAIPLVVSGVALIPNFGSNLNSPGTLFVSANSPISNAPEPSAWALMIIGFCAIALQLKHLRRSGNLPALEMQTHKPGVTGAQLAPVKI